MFFELVLLYFQVNKAYLTLNPTTRTRIYIVKCNGAPEHNPGVRNDITKFVRKTLYSLIFFFHILQLGAEFTDNWK